MAGKYLAAKVIVLVTVSAYFAYALFWFAKTLPWIVQISFKPENYLPAAGLQIVNSHSLFVSYLMEYTGIIGLAIRFTGAVFALFSIVLIFRSGTVFSSNVKKNISRALLLEGIYFFSLIPAIIYLLSFSSLPLTSRLCLSTALTTQIALISPTLILLSRKFAKSNLENPATSINKLAIFACLSYVVALWVTYLLKWIEMSALEGLNWLLSYPMEIAFTNTIITFSLAVSFAAIGTWLAITKSNSGNASKLWGIAAILFSTHLIIFVAYCVNFNAAWMAEFGELWIIPLMGLGIYLLSGKKLSTKLIFH
jgi:hypothetical protein